MHSYNEIQREGWRGSCEVKQLGIFVSFKFSIIFILFLVFSDKSFLLTPDKVRPCVTKILEFNTYFNCDRRGCPVNFAWIFPLSLLHVVYLLVTDLPELLFFSVGTCSEKLVHAFQLDQINN